MDASPIIRTTPELDEACARARAAGVVALDTEFVWQRTYRPRLGLVQIGTPDACWGLDCLQGLKPSALGDVWQSARTAARTIAVNDFITVTSN